MKPNPDLMREHIDHLFSECLEGRVELAWTDSTDGKLRHAHTYALDALDTLIDDATKENSVEGQNVYIGAALRGQDTAPLADAKTRTF